jgi:predicted Fe-Mo cluster-binding NifX family protein
MKIALPLTATDEFSPHYGASAKFTVFDVDPVRRLVLRRLIVVPQDSEPCAWPTLLRAAGVDLVLAGGMGRGAQMHMAEHGLKVLVGVPMGTPEVLVEAWMAGDLATGVNTCDSSGRGRHHHGDHDHAGHCHCAH